MGTKHTPGPWKHEPTSLADFKGFGRDIYSVNERGEYGRHVAQLAPSTVMDADAALIAAAPDLLAACEHSLRNIESQIYMLPVKQHGTVEHQSLESWAQLLRAAIRKATGQ